VHTTAVCVLVRVWAKDFGTREVGICFANPDRARYIYIEDPLPEWFTEQVVLRYFTGVEVRLSGSNVRNQLYIGTAPKLQNLYVARTKTHLSRILPSLSQLPRLP